MSRERLVRLSLLLAVALFSPNFAVAESAPPLVESTRGNFPIVLTMPHGASPKAEIRGARPRKGKGVRHFETTWDVATADLARAVARVLEERYGARPYTVIAEFNRKYADANRSAKDAYEDEDAKPHYDAYHDAIAAYVAEVRERWPKAAILVDIHGQSGFPSAICRGTQNGVTTKRLLAAHGREAIEGPRSVLGHLAAAGYAVRPAGEGKEDPKYNGGYTVRTYGSHTKNGIDAIQLDIGSDLRKKAVRERLARDLADALHTFAGAYLDQTPD